MSHDHDPHPAADQEIRDGVFGLRTDVRGMSHVISNIAVQNSEPRLSDIFDIYDKSVDL